MLSDDNGGQIIFGDLKLPDMCLTGEEKPRKNLTQETCPDWGSNPGLLRDRLACYRLSHSGTHTHTMLFASILCSVDLWIRCLWVRSQPGSMDFSERKNPEYDFLRKGSKAVRTVSMIYGM